MEILVIPKEATTSFDRFRGDAEVVKVPARRHCCGSSGERQSGKLLHLNGVGVGTADAIASPLSHGLRTTMQGGMACSEWLC